MVGIGRDSDRAASAGAFFPKYSISGLSRRWGESTSCVSIHGFCTEESLLAVNFVLIRVVAFTVNDVPGFSSICGNCETVGGGDCKIFESFEPELECTRRASGRPPEGFLLGGGIDIADVFCERRRRQPRW